MFILNKIKRDKDCPITEEDFHVEEVRIEYGKGNQDPIESVIFFNKNGEITTMEKAHISNILPRNFLDRKIRVYCKPDDQYKRNQIRYTFEDWCKQRKYPLQEIIEGKGN